MESVEFYNSAGFYSGHQFIKETDIELNMRNAPAVKHDPKRKAV